MIEPQELARECVAALASSGGRLIDADRIFFSGGAPDIHLPYVEEVVRAARDLVPGTKVNFDTNGYLTEPSFARVLDFATSVTFDLKAYDDEVHTALTGARAEPVLRNAERIGREHPERLWEYRILVIPKITDDQVAPLCEFVAAIDRELPVCLLAFRPNYVLDHHPGASSALMEGCVDIARSKGLRNVHWAGAPNIPGRSAEARADMAALYASSGARLAATYAAEAGCVGAPRGCRDCASPCRMRSYLPSRAW
jgi:pyruvate formate lyase activating enzyme